MVDLPRWKGARQKCLIPGEAVPRWRDRLGRWAKQPHMKTQRIESYTLKANERIRKNVTMNAVACWDRSEGKTNSSNSKKTAKKPVQRQDIGKITHKKKRESVVWKEARKQRCVTAKVKQFEEVSVSGVVVGRTRNGTTVPLSGDLYIYSYRIDLKRLERILNYSRKGEIYTQNDSPYMRLLISKRAESVGKLLDWTRLDQWGRPVVSFTPSKKMRRDMMEVLDKPPQAKVRRQLVKKLGIEYSRIYCRYRRLVEKAAGRQPNYRMGEKEQRHCEMAAIQCLVHRVTPRQVLEYWHQHIRDFADGRMTLPPVTFLKSPRVVAVVAEQGPDTIGGWTIDEIRARSRESVDSGKIFSGTAVLDKRVRHGLNRAGLQTWGMTDQELLQVQTLAGSITAGYEIFVAGKTKKMVDWVIKNIYKGNGRA